MSGRSTRKGRSVKPVQKLDGELKVATKRKRSLKSQPTTTLNTPITIDDDNVSDIENSSEGIIAMGKVFMIEGEDVVENIPSKARPASQKRNSPTPPDEFIPKIPTRLALKCSGKTIQTTKVIPLDFNLEFEPFNEVLLPLIHTKAGEIYDPVNYDPTNLSLKYAIIPNSRAQQLSKKPLSLNEYCDLDDELDYMTLQLEIRKLLSARGQLDKHTLQIHATIIKRADSPRSQHPSPEKLIETPESSQRIVFSLK